jgi:hypothetical protein
MPSSIANVSVSASSFAGGLFLGLCITRIVFFLRFFDFRRVYAAAFPPVSTILFAACLPRMRCNILDKMLHDPKSDCNQELFGGAKGADGRARDEPRGGKGLRGKRKTAHVTFYLKCYMGCRLLILPRILPCPAALDLFYHSWNGL